MLAMYWQYHRHLAPGNHGPGWSLASLNTSRHADTLIQMKTVNHGGNRVPLSSFCNEFLVNLSHSYKTFRQEANKAIKLTVSAAYKWYLFVKAKCSNIEHWIIWMGSSWFLSPVLWLQLFASIKSSSTQYWAGGKNKMHLRNTIIALQCSAVESSVISLMTICSIWVTAALITARCGFEG